MPWLIPTCGFFTLLSSLVKLFSEPFWTKHLSPLSRAKITLALAEKFTHEDPSPYPLWHKEKEIKQLLQNLLKNV